jgi:hypothetical protein
MLKLGTAGLVATVVGAALFFSSSCKTNDGELDAGSAGNAGSGGTAQGGAGSGGSSQAGTGGGPGTGGALGNGPISVADGGGFSSTGKCKAHADCPKNHVCMTSTHCNEGSCFPIPIGCAAKGDTSCACVGDVLCARAYCSEHPDGCQLCSSPP